MIPAPIEALVIERVLKRHYPDNVDHLAVIEEMAHALADAGYKIMAREPTEEPVRCLIALKNAAP